MEFKEEKKRILRNFIKKIILWWKFVLVEEKKCENNFSFRTIAKIEKQKIVK